jgi:zinc protease
MRSLFLLAALAVGPAEESSDTPAPAPARSFFPYAMHVDTLDNGLTVVVVPMKSDGLVSYRSAVRTGARDEYEPGHTGFAHFFEHMMFRGTDKYPEDVYAQMVTRMGADANAYTSNDLTVYQLDVSAADLETVIDIESDRFMNLSYSEAAFKTEAGAVYGEYRKNRTSPWYQMAEALHALAFKKHTYSHLTIGYEKDIKAMPKMFDYSKSFFSRYYRPENVIVIIAGDVDANKTLDTVERYYGKWEQGYVAPKIKTEPRQKKERRKEVTYTGRTLPRIAVAYKGDAYAPDDRTWVASLLLADLAFGPTSEISRRLTLEERVVQSIRASPAADRDPGLWQIDATVRDPAKVEYVLEQIDDVVEKYRTTAPDAATLAAVKANRKYSFLLGLDSPPAVAGRLARVSAITGDPRAYDTLYTAMEQVTPDDVKAAAEKLFVKKQRTVVVLKGKK